MYAGTLTKFIDVVGVHSNSIDTNFNEFGTIPHSGVA